MQKEPKAQFWIHMGIELRVNVLEPDPEWELRWGGERRSPDLSMVILINSHGSTTGYNLSFTTPSQPNHSDCEDSKHRRDSQRAPSQLIGAPQRLGKIAGPHPGQDGLS